MAFPLAQLSPRFLSIVKQDVVHSDDGESNDTGVTEPPIASSDAVETATSDVSIPVLSFYRNS